MGSPRIVGARFKATDSSACFDGSDYLINGTEVISSSRTLENIASGSGSFYVTGSFTPEVADAATAGNTATGTFVGTYTKVGNQVTYSITLDNISTAGMTGGNALFVRNLPFTSISSFQTGTAAFSSISYTSGAMIIPMFTGSSDHLRLKEIATGAGFADVIVSELSTGVTDIYITATIIVN